jgi:hypothetical protein
MISHPKGCSILFVLLFSLLSFSTLAQPTLPDIVGEEENGIVLLSWVCQYDGVKSIAVLRSADSNFNYSTIGFVKKLYKGTQAYADGHPMPGWNFYKLSIVFNSGLTWGSNHVSFYADSATIKKGRTLPANEALQKLIITETPAAGTPPAKTDKARPAGNEHYVNSAVAPADRDKYMEVIKKDPPKPADTVVVVPTPKPQYKVKTDDDDEVDADDYFEKLPEEVRKKMVVTYTDDTGDIDADKYISHDKPAETKKIVNMTFEDKEDAAAFVATLPKNEKKKFTITYNTDTGEVNADNYVSSKKADTVKKVSVVLNSETAMKTYMENIPKNNNNKITISYNIDTANLHNKAIREEVKKESPVLPKQKISIKFSDDMNANAAADVKSKYIFNDAISGHITMSLPDDIATHHYSVKFYDADGHMVIEIPKLNTARIILDKRNFQKKGQYKFVLRRDVVELEQGYINVY